MRRYRAAGTIEASWRLAVGLGVLIAALFVGIATMPGTAAIAAAPVPKLAVSPTTAAPGQTVIVTGTDLTPRSIYQVQVCGQNAVHGSQDCSAAATSTTQVDQTGMLSVPLAVVLPPTQCPCVVAAFPTTVGPQLTTPISIEGASTSNAPTTTPQVPTSHLVVVHAGFTGSTPVKQWFGFQATRTLSLSLLNRGSAPASGMHLFASLGNTPVVSSRLSALGAGQVRTYDVAVAFPALTVGNQTLSGHIVTTDGQLVGFKTSVAVWPVGLLVVGLILAQMILLAWRNIARRRYERNNPKSTDPEDPPTMETEVVPPLSETV
jgi:hypothetical protein